MSSILAFCISSKVSGGEIYLVQLLGALNRSGWTVALAGPRSNAILQRLCRQQAVRYIATDIGPKLSKKTAPELLLRWKSNQRKLFSLIRAESPDVVLFQYKLEQMLWAGSELGRRVIMFEHGPIPRAISSVPFFRKRYERALAAASTRFAASRPAVDAIASWGLPSQILPAGVNKLDVSSSLASAKETRKFLKRKLPNVKSIGIYAGRLTEDKGIVTAAEAISNLPDVGLVIAGSGPLGSRLKGMADKSSNILFLGQISDPMHFTAAADFGILLTNDRGEGRPLFALECASVGVPVIANVHSDAVQDLIREVGIGPVLAIDPSNPGAIESAIERAQRFRPIELDWTSAAQLFNDAAARP